jgi:hypothetical protein
MLFCDFVYKLKRLNSKLHVDSDHEVSPHPSFPCGGLYLDKKYLFAVPHGTVPEYSLVDKATGKILARGYRFIISELINRGHVDRHKAQRVFGMGFEPGRQEFPKKELDLEKDE